MQNQEKIIQSKNCRHCAKSFDITDKDMEFYDKVSPSFATLNVPLIKRESDEEARGIKFQIPTPTLCPDCRQQRRLSFRNERKIYRRKCDATGKDIISIYKPGTEYKIYDQKVRRSDDRDPMTYGRNFDFSKSFTEQFGELMREVPRYNLTNTNTENCDYNNYIDDCKDSYMCFGLSECDKCIYSTNVANSTYMVDGLFAVHQENSYECIDCTWGYQNKYCRNSNNCKYCISCNDCEGCDFCYGSNNLTNQKHCINNKQVSEQKYNDFMNQNNIYIGYNLTSNIKKNIYIQSEDCIGNQIVLSKNAINCFDVVLNQDTKYIYNAGKTMDSYDCSDSNPRTELSYESIRCQGYNLLFTNNIFDKSSYIYYSDSCFSCQNCFGCIGLRNKQYCIFNKQYTETEYSDLVGKIITYMSSPRPADDPLFKGESERGEFFHPSLSPFGYNETVAMEYYGVISEDYNKISEDGIYKDQNLPTSSEWNLLKSYGYKWSDYEAPVPQVDNKINGADLPDNIAEVNDDILKTAIICEISSKPFRIIPQELVFYRKHNIPLPRRHPDQRHADRMKLKSK